MNVIYWAGDSTVQFNDYSTYPQTGLAQGLQRYLKHGIRIENHAKNGRSTKSFLDEGRMSPICADIWKDDFLFIEFGHNDEKKEDPARYTDPSGSFTKNILFMCEKALEKGAHPLLITPVERRKFEGNILKESAHAEYVKAMKDISESRGIALVDLNAKSRKALEKAGPDESKKWYLHFPEGVYEAFPDGACDDTHLSLEGAFFYAGLLAEGLSELGGVYADLLSDGTGDIEHI